MSSLHVRFAIAAALGVLALLATQCAAPGLRAQAQAESAPGVDLASYRSFVWGTSTGFEDLVLVERVRAAVERGLAARGYERADAQAPGWTVHAHGSQREDVVVEPVYRVGATVNSPGSFTSEPRTIRRGTLLLELHEGSGERVLWRGWIEEVLADREHALRVVDEAVEQILSRLPARGPAADR